MTAMNPGQVLDLTYYEENKGIFFSIFFKIDALQGKCFKIK